MTALPYCSHQSAPAALRALAEDGATLSNAELADFCAFLRLEKIKPELIAQAIGRRDYEVRHLIRVGLRLDSSVKSLLHRGSLTLGHARVIASYPQAQQEQLARDTLYRKWSVRELEDQRRGIHRSSTLDHAYYGRLANKMSDIIGYSTAISPDRDNSSSGTLSFRYNSLEEFEGLCKRMRIDLSDSI